MKKATVLLFLLLPITSVWSQELKGDRILGWQVDLAENANYDSAYSYAKNGCMESVHLFFPWSSLEPDADSFSASFIASFLDVVNIYHPANGVRAELQIATVNTVSKETPADLQSVAFDDSLMIARFKIALDTIFAHIPDLELTALNIGNEGDIVWGTDASEYDAYKVFMDSIAVYAKAKYQAIHSDELLVGTTFTHSGLVSPATADLCAEVNQNLDIIATTYYPLQPNFAMEDPSVVFDHFEELVEAYPIQPIYFVECGYSSSEVCESSEFQQAKFYENVFSAWDTHSEHIDYITIFKSTDWSQQEVEDLGVYYGLSDSLFLEYLRTLGVRTWPGGGENKMAYETILCELEAREWCDVSCKPNAVEPAPAKALASVYPNPTGDYVLLESGYPLEIQDVVLMNLQGQRMPCQTSSTAAGLQLSLGSLPPGLYLLRFKANGTKQHHRIIKE